MQQTSVRSGDQFSVSVSEQSLPCWRLNLVCFLGVWESINSKQNSFCSWNALQGCFCDSLQCAKVCAQSPGLSDNLL